VTASATSPGASDAGRYLALLLARRPYRQRWDKPQYVRRGRRDQLHHTAIAQVVADYLQASPREGRPEDRDVEPGQLLSLISNALNGVRLSHETVQVFIAAFEISREDAERVWQIHGGAATVRMLTDPPVVPAETAAALLSDRHRTHSVHDHHYLGADGLPYKHETLQVIEAAVAGLDRYAYAFDTDALTVEVLLGGRLTGPLYHAKAGIYAVDILLDRALGLGERHTLKYQTTFRYRTRPEPEFRRAMSVRVEDADLKVTFHRMRRPKAVWWAQWDSLTGEIVDKEEVELDDYQTASRYLSGVENVIAGFTWLW
jgi:hypothetical protein